MDVDRMVEVADQPPNFDSVERGAGCCGVRAEGFAIDQPVMSVCVVAVEVT